MTGHVYDDTFFDYIEAGARASARSVIATALGALRPASVLDVGCGRGAWLAEWRAAGVEDVAGLDGDYVARDRLAIPPGRFHAADLTRPADLGRRFDLVQCLEVGEHLRREASATLVATLCRHGDIVAFSAAVPGQGGENHINERPLEDWRDLFAARGYAAFDALRPALADRPGIEPWYRYNMLLYANAAGEARLPGVMAAARLDPAAPIPRRGDAAWRLRLALVRVLPRPAVTAIARVRAYVIARSARRRGAAP
jgi:SAM-dependent methyltransferase